MVKIYTSDKHNGDSHFNDIKEAAYISHNLSQNFWFWTFQRGLLLGKYPVLTFELKIKSRSAFGEKKKKKKKKKKKAHFR